MENVARYIDHTLLKPEATAQQVVELCEEALQYQFASVCINPVFVSLAAKTLREANSAVCTVVGFPLGASLTRVKCYETEHALNEGATEIDMVIHIGALKGGNYNTVQSDIEAVVNLTRGADGLTKVIIETALLSDEEKITACKIVQQAGAEFVKTSTGFSTGGATLADVSLMRRTVGPEMGVKAAGGIRDYLSARKMIEAGATRLGASAGVKIVQEATNTAS